MVGLGFYVMWSAAKAVNFTYGDIFMLGGVLTVVFMDLGVPLLPAAAGAIAVATATAALVERFFVRPFNTEVNAIGWMLMTIAVGTMLEAGLTATYGPLGRPLPTPLVAQPIRLGGAGIYPQELLLPVALIGVTLALEAFYTRTMTGRAMRAVAFNRTAAGLVGIDADRITLLAFALAGAMGAFAGFLVAPVVQASSSMGAIVGLKGFMVAIIAGIANARRRGGRHTLRRDGKVHRGLSLHRGARRDRLHRHDPGAAAVPAGPVRAEGRPEGMSAMRWGWLALLVMAAAIAGFPWVGDLIGERFPTSYELRIVMRAMILAIVVFGLNLLVGFAGLVSLGQAALYGLGAHVAALLSLRAGMPFAASMGFAVLIPAMMGAVLAFPTVRVRGVYLAVITIAFGLIFTNILREWVSFTGGASGLANLPRPTLLGERLMATRVTSFNYYYLILACLLASVWVQFAITHSRYGRAMRAAAQSENAARALGVNVVGIRTLAFAVSAGFAGLGGGLFANLALFVNYETFSFTTSIELLLMVILGGSGTMAGPLVGTAVLFAATQFLQGLGEWQTFAYGLLLAVVLFVLPKGVVGSAAALLARLRPAPKPRATGDWPHWGPGLEAVTATREEGGQATLIARGITLRFGGLTAVNGVDMEVQAGTVHALIGPNGAGKSSLLNVISGFYRLTEGSVTLFGRALRDDPPHALARAGVARSFQNTELFGRMTVLENVLVGGHPHFRAGFLETVLRLPRFRREERAARAEALRLLDFVGLTEFADEEARNLPFGHQRRLEIARALALRPRLLLLDEPAAGLTHGEIDHLVQLIRGLADRGMTVILVEHHVDMIMAVSDRVTVLDYGEVIADGTVTEVQADPRVIEAYFGAGAPSPQAVAAE
jgi:branched-chain amino acid transport system permease protein